MPEAPSAVLLEVLWVLTRAVGRLPADLLHAVPDPDLVLPLFTSRALPTPIQVYCNCVAAMKIIACWPKAFHQFLDAYRRRPGVTEGNITAEFAPCISPGWRNVGGAGVWFCPGCL